MREDAVTTGDDTTTTHDDAVTMSDDAVRMRDDAVTMRDDGYLVVPVDVLSSRLLRCICSPGVAN